MKQSGASKAGFHMLESFKSCKRKWWFRYPLGIEPDRKPFQLVFGSSFHHGKAVFYETKSEKRAIAAFKRSLSESRHEIEEERKYYPMMLTRGPVMLSKWIRLLGKNDLLTYKILALEEVIEFKLPNGYLFTIKPDVVVEGPQGVYLFDTKTSWFSPYLQSEQMETSDQTSAYIYGWNLKHPRKRAIGLVPDCIYWNVNSEDPEKIQCNRSTLVTRTAVELEEWVQGAMSDLADMASRVKTWKAGNEAARFPRTTSYCLSFNRKCEYIEICRHRIQGVPGTFHLNKWTGREQLLKAAGRFKT